ncbi:MAG: 4-alpha-glucanotransferase [Candidatus Gastranaerophilales bacterium]|nr:4-alpha-glucanotransferase [Candidatus Gastranaerophilales bacterium]
MPKTCCKKSCSEKGETKNLTKTIKDALKVLKKKNLAMIIHGASFPSAEGQDVGFGSYNSEGAKKFVEFIAQYGFNGIQLGPDGKTKSIDASPYIGTMFSNNPLFIDLYGLTTEDYGCILDKEIFDKIVRENPSKTNRTAYSYIYNEHNKALREAYKVFKSKLEAGDKVIKKLNKKFEQFVEDNVLWLEKDAVYEALSVKYGNDYWPMWNDELDKMLYCLSCKAGVDYSQKDADKRMKEIKATYGQEIEFYQFVQFLAYMQKQETQKFLGKQKMKTIADCQVAFSDRDYWANQTYFLKDYNLGCPPDQFSADGQAWGFPVVDPDYLFKANGSLNDAGKILKARFAKMFEENPGGVRIDHIIGLIDPFVYKKGALPKVEQGASRLYSSPEHEFLSKYAIPTMENLNPEVGPEDEKRVINLTDKQVKKYARFLEKLVIEAAEEKGIGKEAIICEDLGTITNPTLAVMEKLELSGLRVTSFVDPEVADHPYRIKNTEPQHWVMVGSHDNNPFLCWVDELYAQNKVAEHAQRLAEDLRPEQVEAFKQELINDKNKFIAAKYAELFASGAENVQIFFADFFGMRERYNFPGTSGDENWSLRVPLDYECVYKETLFRREALNLPLALALAIESKGKKFAEKHEELLKTLKDHANKLSDGQ